MLSSDGIARRETPDGTVELYYQDLGDLADPPVLLIMGLGAQLPMWPDGFCARLVNTGHRVIRFDHRDTGLSAKMHGTRAEGSVYRRVGRYLLGKTSPVPYTLIDMAGDVRALLDHLGIERAHFIGGSQGAAAVLALAVRYPDRASALILRNPPEVRQHDLKYISGIMEYADFIEQNGMDVVTDLILNLPPNDSLKTTHPQLHESYDRIMRVQDPQVVAAATRGTVQFAPITPRELHGVRCPTLVLSQKGDGLHPTDIAEYLTSNIPDCEAFIAPTMTYYNENPEEGPRRLMTFLSRIDGTVWE